MELTLIARIAALRVELVELAYTLDRRGQPEASDVANLVAARLAELGEADASGVSGVKNENE